MKFSKIYLDYEFYKKFYKKSKKFIKEITYEKKKDKIKQI